MAVPKFVPRFDTYEGGKIIEDRILDDVANPNDPQNVIIAGFPGVGKSYTAKAIAATYASNGSPAVILSVQNKNEIHESKIALVDIGQFTKQNSRVVAVPVVSISARSMNSEDVVQKITNSLKSLEQNLGSVKEILGSTADAIKIKEGLEKLIDRDLIPKEYDHLLDLAKDIIGALPYIRSALNITLTIVDYYMKKQQQKMLDRLRKQNLLVVVDDFRDLGPNWQILSDVLEDSFRYVFVTRIEDIEEYLKLMDDKTYANQYLHDKNYPIIISRLEIIPPPSRNTFNAILDNHVIRKEDIDPLWSISGGIPAIALMILQEIPTITNRDLELILQEVGNLIKNKAQIHWSESDYRKRLAMALYATMQIFQRLIKDNKVYGLLCCDRNGVTQDEILIFCGCNSENDVIYIPTNEIETKERIKKIITEKQCCPDGRDMRIRTPPAGGTDCCIDSFRDSIVKYYVGSLNENDLSNGPNEDQQPPGTPHSGTAPLPQKVYKFTESFEHLSLLLKIIEDLEKSGFRISPTFKTISSDLNQIRDTLNCIRKCLSQIGIQKGTDKGDIDITENIIKIVPRETRIVSGMPARLLAYISDNANKPIPDIEVHFDIEDSTIIKSLDAPSVKANANGIAVLRIQGNKAGSTKVHAAIELDNKRVYDTCTVIVSWLLSPHVRKKK